MSPISRREFAATALLAGARAAKLRAAAGLDDALRASVQARGIPVAVAMVAGAGKTIYAGAFGKRDSASGVDATTRSIFRIASMTKAVTTVAALQLVERGTVKLDEPVSRHLPQLGSLRVLDGFDSAGQPRLRPARQPVLLRHLLTHTSGFVYDIWDADLLRYDGHQAGSGASSTAPPLLFEPGTRWEYGTGIDWTGRLVEAVTGQTLEDYFQRHILAPLGMTDTSYILPPEKFDRLVNTWRRQEGGSLAEDVRTPPAAPKSFNGGGGLYSTAGDYVRFMQMILRRGRSTDGRQILRAETVGLMTSNQTGALSAGKLRSVQPDVSRDVDFHPGSTDGFTFGFLINAEGYAGGRSAGSLAWAGLYNTFFWIDPRRALCAVLLSQFLPFCDAAAAGLLRDFERAVYAA